MADQLTLTTIGGTATHTLDDSGNATHTGAVTGATMTATTSLTTDTIAERTSAAGVTVDGCLIKDGRAAALATASMFLSTEQTGTGSAQNVAHGLGAVPTMTFAVITGGHNGIGGAGNQCPIFTYGTHTSTNCVFTTEAGTTFRVVAFK